MVLNKWELVATEDRHDILADVGDRLAFLGEAPVLRISALSGGASTTSCPAVRAAEEAYHQRVPTGELNRALQDIQTAPPAARAPRSGTASRGPTTPRPSRCSPTGACPDLPPLRRARTARAVRPRLRPRSSCGSASAGSERRTVPWCEECDSLVEDEELTEDGACPACGTVLAERSAAVPWYFKFMLVATVIYLGWRAFQGSPGSCTSLLSQARGLRHGHLPTEATSRRRIHPEAYVHPDAVSSAT